MLSNFPTDLKLSYDNSSHDYEPKPSILDNEPNSTHQPQ